MTVWNDFMDLIFPNACMVCEHKVSSKNHFICLHCKQQLPYTNHFHIQENELSRKLDPLFDFERAAALLYFETGSAPQKLIHQFKYHQKKKLAFEMGHLMGLQLNNTSWVEEIDYLVPVPLHPDKLIKRGFNQSYQLALGISHCTGIPILKDVLHRRKNKKSQTKKSKQERLLSVAQNFEWETSKLTNLNSIALIDDVVTTGATASACINSLPQSNRADVYFISLAMDV